MSRRSDLVAQAEAMLGVTAWSAAHEQLIGEYNEIVPLPQGFRMDMTQPWCATFVSVMAKRAGMQDFPFECSCPRMVSLFANQGRWVEDDAYVPTAGDIIFYDWDDTGSGDCTGTPDHVGIVWSCNGESMNIIEGNISSKVGTRFIPCNAQYVRGFGIPNFEDTITTVSTPVEETGTVGYTSVQIGTDDTETADNLYTIKSGDSWWKIAKDELGNSDLWQDLMYLNGYTSPEELIFAGQVIKLWDDGCASCQLSDEPESLESDNTADLKQYLEIEVQKLGGHIVWDEL